MANIKLIEMMERRRISVAYLAKEVGVTTNAVNSWTKRGRIPRYDTRYEVAKVLQCKPHDLWPEVMPPDGVAYQEIIDAWASRSDCPKDVRWNLFREASNRVDLLGDAMQFLFEDDADIFDVLREKANSGCNVHVVMPTLVVSAQQDVASQLHFREKLWQRAFGLWKDERGVMLIGTRKLSLRYQESPMPLLICRFDDHMFVGMNLYQRPGYHSPLIQLHRGDSGGMFRRYEQDFEDLFKASLRSDPSSPRSPEVPE